MTTPQVPPEDREGEARRILASICYRNGCRETTRDEIVAGHTAGLVRIKASDAIEAITAALQSLPAKGEVERLREAAFEEAATLIEMWIDIDDAEDIPSRLRTYADALSSKGDKE